MSNATSYYSLSELTGQVRQAIKTYLPDTYWVRAETLDVRQNQNGHCYLEFVEKDPNTQNIIAKARGMIWANVYEMLSAYFLNVTGQPFGSGLNVLVRVSVEFQPQFGFSLHVVDIDPSYTVGEIALQRNRILQQLEQEGILLLNKELNMPELPRRLAIISSPTAAGYEDFCQQLHNNAMGVVFYTKLFPAIMQGDRCEESIIQALEKIYHFQHLFDAVVIIRGGGATADLHCYDGYSLAVNCAQFPIPIISGIGHERDVTILDHVAHTHVKTPTAAAEEILRMVGESVRHLIGLQDSVVRCTKEVISAERHFLSSMTSSMFHGSVGVVKEAQQELVYLWKTICLAAKNRVMQEQTMIQHTEQVVELASPQTILKKGYTLTSAHGKVVTSAHQLPPGTEVETQFSDGTVRSVVIS